MSILIFVYGTLKNGEPNHQLIQKETRGTCVPRGKAKTAEKFPLVVASRYNVPYLLHEPGKGEVRNMEHVMHLLYTQHVEGEVYEVCETRLAILDELESHPHLYERRETTVIITIDDLTSGDVTSEGCKEVNVHAYFLVKYRPHLLELPMLGSFTDAVGGKKYIGRKNRQVPSPAWWFEVHRDHDEPE